VAHLPLRVAIVAPAGLGGADKPPAIVSGATRAWLRSRRSEPFAACVSMHGSSGYAEELLAELESEFRSAPRLSITTGLGRAVRAAHTHLIDENRLALPDQRRSASAVLVAARSNGLYIARTGSAIVAAVRSRGTWARSGDPSALGAGRETPGIGRAVAPHITSEFCPLEPGDAMLLLPGVSVADVPDPVLTAALHDPLDLDRVGELLIGTPAESCGLVIWSPQEDAAPDTTGRWIDWANAAPQTEHRPARQTRAPVERPAASRAPVAIHRTASAVPAPRRHEQSDGGLPKLGSRSLSVPSTSSLPPAVANALRTWASPPRLAIGILGIILIFLLLRSVSPFSVIGADHGVDDARRIIQEARANRDPDVASALLSDAIGVLEPRAARDDNARTLLQDAREAQDRIRNVVRVTRVRTFSFDAGPEFRPAGIWNTENGTFILDLGGQLLYRFDQEGARLSVALKPDEALDGQPLGKLVTAAWSPARGVDTQGQLLVLDSFRSVVSLNARGSTARRWTPPDSAIWDRLGPAAATFEDFYFLDTARGEIWRYPARLPGAAGTIVATTQDEPLLGIAADIATDGNLYVLLPDGGVTKLAPGSGTLPFEGVVPDQPLSSPVAIYAHADLDRVWILEPSAARVVEFTTEGKYVRQFVFPPDLLRNAVGLNVDSASQELRILTPQQMVLVQLS